MPVSLMKSRLHHAVATQADLDCEGSIAIDRDLPDHADILPHARIDVLNITTGARVTICAIEAPGGSRVIGANGAAARLVQKTDRVILVLRTAAAGRGPQLQPRRRPRRPQRDQAGGVECCLFLPLGGGLRSRAPLHRFRRDRCDLAVPALNP
ncbi:MAG: aspartate 1-decarboxylase [Brevundimonas sp.]|jgi:aspartate 1-decarboxylase|uniref:aspartate 1-decarboxylase n=1 Tax=Brevundimonas sp. TaxID=1871086 RepID=UPI0022C60606|nr:aspartate 1-decarboxylase [Brevundimonas sp.]